MACNAQPAMYTSEDQPPTRCARALVTMAPLFAVVEKMAVVTEIDGHWQIFHSDELWSEKEESSEHE